MSDLIAPTPVQPQYWDPSEGLRTTEDPITLQMVNLLLDIRTELRILNATSKAGFNLLDDTDILRTDPYFTNPSPLVAI